MRLSERDGARPQSPLLHFGWSLPLVKAIRTYYFAAKPPLTGRLFLYSRTLKIAVSFACAAGAGALPPGPRPCADGAGALPRTPVLRGRRRGAAPDPGPARTAPKGLVPLESLSRLRAG